MRLDEENDYKPASTTDSDPAHELVVSWLEQCVKGHARCNHRRPNKWFPTRVLDIGDSEDDIIRLINDRDALPNEPYATLSHCWGMYPTPKTLQENYKARCAKIHPDELTKTFMDAIQIIRSLGLRYIWIDSLCIVQDSPDDWGNEAARMSNVYRYGYINIAATGATNGSEGCHWDRSPDDIRPTIFAVAWSHLENGQSWRYQVVPDPDFWARKLLNEPLNQRGWILQERILAPRVIHFGRAQLFWECRETIACETYWKGLPPSLRQNTFVDVKTLDLGDAPQDERWPSRYTSDLEMPQTMMHRLWDMVLRYARPVKLQEVNFYAALNDASVYRDWTTIAELYSLGLLTMKQDKLVALSGIASVIVLDKGRDTHDGYLAGLWHSSLPLHLLWITEVYTRNRSAGPETCTPIAYLDHQPGQYIAPSWSWASIEGKISFAWCHNNYNTKERLATLEDARVVWAREGARFGSVEFGEVSVSAPVASVLWEDAAGNPGTTAPMSGTITHVFPIDHNHQMAVAVPPDAADQAEIRFDTVLQSRPSELVLVPVIGTAKKLAHERELVLGLVLHRLEGSTQFRRLGVFHTTRLRINRILRKLPRRTVTIV